MSKQKFVSFALSFLLLALSAFGSACGSAELKIQTASAETLEDADAPAARTQTEPEPVTIAAVGDVMLGSTSIDETFLPPEDGRDMLKAAAPILSVADIAFGNLEGPIIDGGISEKCPPLPPVPEGDPPPKINCFAFRTPTRYAKYLKEAGFDVLSLANNHASDFGEEGRASTRRVLDRLEIKHAGADRARFASTVVSAKGNRVAFVAFAHNNVSYNVNNLATARRVVADLARRADLVVVSFHGGAEGSAASRVPYAPETFAGEKRGNLRAFTRAVIDAGADLVLGHGPHVLRGAEIYKDRLALYSMGNFATYGMFNLKGALGVTGVFELRLAPDGKFLDGRLHPFKQIGRGVPIRDETGEAIKIMRRLSAADFGTNAPKFGDDGSISAK